MGLRSKVATVDFRKSSCTLNNGLLWFGLYCSCYCGTPATDQTMIRLVCKSNPFTNATFSKGVPDTDDEFPADSAQRRSTAIPSFHRRRLITNRVAISVDGQIGAIAAQMSTLHVGMLQLIFRLLQQSSKIHHRQPKPLSK